MEKAKLFIYVPSKQTTTPTALEASIKKATRAVVYATILIIIAVLAFVKVMFDAGVVTTLWAGLAMVFVILFLFTLAVAIQVRRRLKQPSKQSPDSTMR